MPSYRVSAAVTADVVIIIEAENEEAAKEKFDAGIGVNANLYDIPESEFFVEDDGVSEVGDMEAVEI